MPSAWPQEGRGEWRDDPGGQGRRAEWASVAVSHNAGDIV